MGGEASIPSIFPHSLLLAMVWGPGNATAFCDHGPSLGSDSCWALQPLASWSPEAVGMLAPTPPEFAYILGSP